MTIEYVFRLHDGRTFQFAVETERSTLPQLPAAAEFAPWTALDFHKCAHCPLPSATVSRCPAAVDAQAMTETFRSILSHTQVTVEVRTPERTHVKQTDVQTGLRALFGLVLATSGCPILAQLKGLARTHLPFATLEETLFRTVGAYLIQQYLLSRKGLTPDWELHGLNALYQQLREVSFCFKSRIDAASEHDANMNAIGALICLSMAVSDSLESQLQEIEHLTLTHSTAPH